MSVDIRTTGYRFSVRSDGQEIGIVSKTEIPISRSQGIIRDFFDNFNVIKDTEPTPKNGTPRTPNNEGKLKDPEKKISWPKGTDKAPKKSVTAPSPVQSPRKGRSLVGMWVNIEKELPDEFTHTQYKEILRKLGYKYTKGSWDTVPSQQLRRFAEMGKIQKLEGERPSRFRKIFFMVG